VDLESLPLQHLVRQLAAHGSQLVRKELELARIEWRQDFTRQAGRLLLVGAIGLTASAALLVLCIAGVAGLGVAMGGNYWASALIIGGALAALAAASALSLRTRGRARTLPHTRRELSAIKEDLTWASPTTTATP
jgi:Putative Actinobacterial Holin-X, holin superfamily III